MTQQEQIWQDVMELANRPGTFTHGLGLHVTGIGDGWAEGELTAGDGMLNPLGIVHGGVYAAMMDHVAGTAACSRGSTCRTVNYDLHYLAPAQPGLVASPGGERPHGAADRGDAGLGGGRPGRPLRRGLLHLPLQARRTQGLIPPRQIKATLRRWRRVAFVLRLSGKSGKKRSLRSHGRRDLFNY
ncbi:MAG: PaaI family thioesterase [Vescimonas sp.]